MRVYFQMNTTAHLIKRNMIITKYIEKNNSTSKQEELL